MPSTHTPKLLTLVAIAAPLLGGCSGALWGNVVVLAVSAGIFVGTLSLGRRSEATRSEASRSAEASTPTAPRA